MHTVAARSTPVIRLGYSCVAFTLDTFARVMPGMRSESAAKLSSLVFDVNGEKREQD